MCVGRCGLCGCGCIGGVKMIVCVGECGYTCVNMWICVDELAVCVNVMYVGVVLVCGCVCMSECARRCVGCG